MILNPILCVQGGAAGGGGRAEPGGVGGLGGEEAGGARDQHRLVRQVPLPGRRRRLDEHTAACVRVMILQTFQSDSQ